MTFDAASALRLIEESLRLVRHLGAAPITPRRVAMSDRTLVVEIVATTQDSVGLRKEIANVMGALSGLDVPGLFPALSVQSYGVRAYGPDGRELLWVLSSVAAAGFIARGEPIEWLARSLVQENTAEYRRSQADRIIGQVETAFRDLLDHHGMAYGERYVERLWPVKTVKALKQAARREGTDPDDRGLLDYAYLHDLREALRDHRDWFQDGCLADADELERTLTEMNKVRRKVAHHRVISDEDIVMCHRVADVVLTPLGDAHPELVADFLVDRWEEQVHAAFSAAQQGVAAPEVPEQGSAPALLRREAVVVALEEQRTAIEAAIGVLGRLVVPAQRRAMHTTALDALTRWREALDELVGGARQPGLTPQVAEAAKTRYERTLAEVADLHKRIRAMRVGMESAA